MSLICHYYNDCNTFPHLKNKKIEFPQKKELHKPISSNPIAIKSNDISFELNNKSGCFDPNTKHSPSNAFIHNLTNRMNDYYTELSITHEHLHRERSNTMELFIIKHK
jgi:hypothetical protein